LLPINVDGLNADCTGSAELSAFGEREFSRVFFFGGGILHFQKKEFPVALTNIFEALHKYCHSFDNKQHQTN